MRPWPKLGLNVSFLKVDYHNLNFTFSLEGPRSCFSCTGKKHIFSNPSFLMLTLQNNSLLDN